MQDNIKDKRSIFIQAIYNASLEILGAAESESIFSNISGWNIDASIIEDDSVLRVIADLGNEFSIRYQRNTSQGLLIRIGESAFAFLRMGLKELQEIGSLENRLKPITERFNYSINGLSRIISELCEIEINGIQKEETTYCLRFSDQLNELFSSDMYLHFFGGILRAFGAWIDGRKEYSIFLPEGGDLSMEKLVCFSYSNSG